MEYDADSSKLRQLYIVLGIALIDYLYVVVYPVGGIGSLVLSLRSELRSLSFREEKPACLIQIQLRVYKGHGINLTEEGILLLQMGSVVLRSFPLFSFS